MLNAGSHHGEIIIHHSFQRLLCHFLIVSVRKDVTRQQSIQPGFGVLYQAHSKSLFNRFFGAGHIYAFISKFIFERFPAELKRHLEKMKDTGLLTFIFGRSGTGARKAIIRPVQIL